MPTEKKVKEVERIRKLIEECTGLVTADFSDMKVGQMTDLRRSLRERGVEFHVIKNRLAFLAVEAAKKPQIKDIMQGPTGIAVGFEDPLEPVRSITDFITASKSPLKVIGGLLDDRVLSPSEVSDLSKLPSKEVLLAQLLGQFQSPMVSLVYVLSAPLSGLARVLQRYVEVMESQGQQSGLDLGSEKAETAQPESEEVVSSDQDDTSEEIS